MKNTFLCGPYLVWIAAFIIIPLLFIGYYGFTDGNGHFTLDNVAAIKQATYYKALWMSVRLAFVSTVICLLIAYPLALILRGMNVGKKGFMVFIFILPMWMNFLLRTYAWQAILDINGVLDNLLNKLHLPGFNIINTPYAIVLGMIYDFLPFMVIASGVIMVFVPALTTFVISDILGGGKLLLIGNLIENKVKADNLHLSAGLSLILMIFIVVNMLFTAKYDKAEGGNIL